MTTTPSGPGGADDGYDTLTPEQWAAIDDEWWPPHAPGSEPDRRKLADSAYILGQQHERAKHPPFDGEVFVAWLVDTYDYIDTYAIAELAREMVAHITGADRLG